MTARERDLLRLLERTGPCDARAIKNAIRAPRSSTFDLLRKLRDAGLIGQEDAGHYVLLDAGRTALAGAAEADQPSARLRPRLALPHLEHAPTPLHRALLELVLCSVAVRHRKLRPVHHPAFVLLGPGMKFKSWSADAACLIVGADPRRCIAQLPSETGHSLTIRKDARGDRVTERSVLLTEKVIGLDEFGRAKPTVKKLAELFLRGQIEIADEQGPIEFLGTPLVMMNPAEGSTPADTIEARTGLDEAMIRRSVVVDLTSVEIPKAIRRKGDNLLDAIRALGAAEIPAPQLPTFDPSEAIDQALSDVFASEERLGRINLNLLAQLALGATAWLDADEALELVLFNYCEIVERLNWLKPDWQERLRQALSAHEEEPGVALEDDDENPFSYEAKLAGFAAAAREAGVDLEQAAERMRRIGRLESQKIDDDDVTEVLDALDGLRERGLTLEDMHAVRSALREVNASPRKAARLLLSLARDAAALRAEVKQLVRTRARVVAELREKNRDNARLKSNAIAVVESELRCRTLVAEIAAAETLLVARREELRTLGQARRASAEERSA